MTKSSLLLAILLLAFLNLLGQEKLVHFFPEQNILTINRGYADKMSFFREYNNFVEAKLFLLEDSNYVLEVFYLKNDSTYKDRKLFTPKEKDLYLQSMLAQYAAKTEVTVKNDSGQVVALNQQGRPAMLVMNTITGLGFYGYGVPLMLNVEDGKAFVGLYMLAASSAFYIPYRATMYKNVSKAQASLSFYGQSRGILHGMLLSEIITRDVYYEDYTNYVQYENDLQSKEQTRFAIGILGSVTGGILGNHFAAKQGYDGGSTSIMQMWGDAGTISGFLVSDLLGFYNSSNTDPIYATSMITTAAGLYVGKKFADTRSYSLGDAMVYRSTLLLGCIVPATIVNYFEPSNEKTYTSAVLVGGLGAGVLGWHLLKDRQFDTSEGVFTALGEISGALLGLGIGYLIAPDINDGKLITTTAMAGAVGGYLLMFNRYDTKKTALGFNPNLDMSINPLALFQNDRQRINHSIINPNYFATIRMRF